MEIIVIVIVVVVVVGGLGVLVTCASACRRSQQARKRAGPGESSNKNLQPMSVPTNPAAPATFVYTAVVLDASLTSTLNSHVRAHFPKYVAKSLSVPIDRVHILLIRERQVQSGQETRRTSRQGTNMKAQTQITVGVRCDPETDTDEKVDSIRHDFGRLRDGIVQEVKNGVYQRDVRSLDVMVTEAKVISLNLLPSGGPDLAQFSREHGPVVNRMSVSANELADISRGNTGSGSGLADVEELSDEASILLLALDNRQHGYDFDPKIGYVSGVRIIHSNEVATIRFRGQTHFSQGADDPWLGIEFLESDKSKPWNDGSIDGTRYFKAPPHSSLFVSPLSIQSPFVPGGYKYAQIDGYLRHWSSGLFGPVISARQWAALPPREGQILLYQQPWDSVPATVIPLDAYHANSEAFGSIKRRGFTLRLKANLSFAQNNLKAGGEDRKKVESLRAVFYFIAADEWERDAWILAIKREKGEDVTGYFPANKT
eukprot:c7045_g1_i1.p1 GENE.c7045_g1_i1~~c7045_g1_i1.p1  ORF type:complete len:485 (-),score=73.92 c7045_g1_i1:140-1594(-)